MWFWLALIALLFWSGSDLFSKIGCRDPRDKLSHLKMVMAVGLVMGLHAAYEIFIGGVEINGEVLLTYLPVSALYTRLLQRSAGGCIFGAETSIKAISAKPPSRSTPPSKPSAA